MMHAIPNGRTFPSTPSPPAPLRATACQLAQPFLWKEAAEQAPRSRPEREMNRGGYAGSVMDSLRCSGRQMAAVVWHFTWTGPPELHLRPAAGLLGEWPSGGIPPLPQTPETLRAGHVWISPQLATSIHHLLISSSDETRAHPCLARNNMRGRSYLRFVNQSLTLYQRKRKATHAVNT
jgi:hypothetical protein